MLRVPLFLDDPPPVPLSLMSGVAAANVPPGDAFAAAYPVLAPGFGIHLTPRGAVVLSGGFPVTRVNGAAAEVLAAVSGAATVGDVAEGLARRHSDRPERAAALLSGFLATATGRGVVRFAAEPQAQAQPQAQPRTQPRTQPHKARVSGATDRFVPYSVSIELTRACTLRCRHCYAGGGTAAEGELTTDEWLSVVDGLAGGAAGAFFTGGEPLLRPDAREIVEHAAAAGLSVGVLTSGARVDAAAAAWLRASGVDPVQVSLDGPDAATHDEARGAPGSFQVATGAMRLLVEAGVRVQAGMTVSTATVGALPATAALAKRLGARSLRVGRLLRRGRARAANLDFTLPDYERLVARLDEAAALTRGDGFAVAFEGTRDWLVTFPGGATLGRYMEFRDRFARAAGGNCGAGWLAAFIGATGEVRPCPVTEVALGTARTGAGLDAVMGAERALAYGDIVAPGARMCGGCPHLFRCVACNSEAFEYGRETAACRWAAQVLRGGVRPGDYWRPGAG